MEAIKIERTSTFISIYFILALACVVYGFHPYYLDYPNPRFVTPLYVVVIFIIAAIYLLWTKHQLTIDNTGFQFPGKVKRDWGEVQKLEFINNPGHNGPNRQLVFHYRGGTETEKVHLNWVTVDFKDLQRMLLEHFDEKNFDHIRVEYKEKNELMVLRKG